MMAEYFVINSIHCSHLQIVLLKSCVISLKSEIFLKALTWLSQVQSSASCLTTVDLTQLIWTTSNTWLIWHGWFEQLQIRGWRLIWTITNTRLLWTKQAACYFFWDLEQSATESFRVREVCILLCAVPNTLSGSQPSCRNTYFQVVLSW